MKSAQQTKTTAPLHKNEALGRRQGEREEETRCQAEEADGLAKLVADLIDRMEA